MEATYPNFVHIDTRLKQWIAQFLGYRGRQFWIPTKYQAKDKWEKSDWIQNREWFQKYFRTPVSFLREVIIPQNIVTGSWEYIGSPAQWEGLYLPDYVHVHQTKLESEWYDDPVSMLIERVGYKDHFVETNSNPAKGYTVQKYFKVNDVGKRDPRKELNAWFLETKKPPFGGWTWLEWVKPKFNIRRGWYKFVEYSYDHLVWFNNQQNAKWEWVYNLEDLRMRKKYKPYTILNKMVISGIQMMAFSWSSREDLFSNIYDGFSSVGKALYSPTLEVASLNWRNVINSRYLGDIMARMYIGRWDVDMEQDFGLNWKSDSYQSQIELSQSGWIKSLWKDGFEMSVFTSTTITWQLLARSLSKIQRLQRGHWVGPEVLDCLPARYVDDFVYRGDRQRAAEQIQKRLDRSYKKYEKLHRNSVRDVFQVFIDYTRAVWLKGKRRTPTTQDRIGYFKLWFDYLEPWLKKSVKRTPTRKQIRRQVRINAVNYLYELGLFRSGKPIKFDEKKSREILSYKLGVEKFAEQVSEQIHSEWKAADDWRTMDLGELPPEEGGFSMAEMMGLTEEEYAGMEFDHYEVSPGWKDVDPWINVKSGEVEFVSEKPPLKELAKQFKKE
jgi:hypothetical protein